MKIKTVVDELIIYRAIDDVLWNDWDPINLNDNENLRDEYQRYALVIYRLKIDGATMEVIASKLFEIETKITGIEACYSKCIEIASKIIALK